MTKQEVINYYGGMKEAAAALDIWPQTIYLWKVLVPVNMQYKIEACTRGDLRVDESLRVKPMRVKQTK